MFLNLQKVNKTYRTGDISFHALKNIDLQMEEGQVGVVLGPSGSGKSTLLNVIGGIDQPDGGAIAVDGVKITDYSDRQLTEYRRESVGFVFQFYNLVPNLTVLENVEVAARISRNAMDLSEVLEAVGLADYRHRFPRELSGGQQQRVSVARAIVKRPKLLLCDEPTGAVDFDTSKEILKLIEHINQKYRATVLIITHNEAIAGMAHRIIRLKSGEVAENEVNSAILPAEGIEW